MLLRSVAGSVAPTGAIEEARLLARVRHPNVLAVYGAECVDGEIGIWTEFIEGRTLEEALAERGPFPPEDVVAIGRDLCRALGAVHAAGLLHRDIKSQNVMRETGGRIVLMDFGTGHDLRVRPIVAGDVSGTPLYLAPEILAGGEATQASDVYALAVLLFRLLTREFPVTGGTLEHVRSGHRMGTITRLSDVRPGLPSRLVEVIERGLASDPAQRYLNAAAFEAALEAAVTPAGESNPIPVSPRLRRGWRLGLAAAALIAVSSLATWQWTSRHPPVAVALTERDWVLVADFDNRTGNPVFDNFAQYALERELVNSKTVRVISRERVDSTLRLMRRPVDSVLSVDAAREVALRDGEVRVVVTGEVLRLGSGYALTASLISPQAGEVLAGVTRQARFQSELTAAVRGMSDEIRARLGEVQASISAQAKRYEPVTTPSFKALQTYTRAFDLGSRNEWDASRVLARQAVAEDPTFATARIWLAWTLFNTNQKPEALREASAAVALVDGAADWERYWIRGSAHAMAGSEAQAIEDYKALVELRPDFLWGARNLALRTGESQYLVRRADLLPHDMSAQFNATRGLYITGAPAAAVEAYWRRGAALLAADPAPSLRTAPWPALLFPAMLRLDAGDLRAASMEIERALADSTGTDTDVRQMRLLDAFMLYASMGQMDAGRRHLRAEGRWEVDRIALMGVADLYTGRPEAARAALARVRMGGPEGPPFWVSPFWAMTRLGLLTQADASLAAIQADGVLPPDDPGLAWARGEIAFVRGDTDRALAILEPVIEKLVTAPRLLKHGQSAEQFYRCSLTVSDAWLRKGDVNNAIKTLQAALDKRIRPFKASGLARLSVLARLAVLERRRGRTNEATVLEEQLQKSLELADPEFVRELARVAAR